MTTFFIGRKGFTLPKAHFEESVLENLKLELTARPISGLQPRTDTKKQNKKITGYYALVQALNDPYNKTFPVYRESKKHFYMPRFFGVKRFGDCKVLHSIYAQNIDVPFCGTLRDNQTVVVDKYMEHLPTGGGILELACAYGKTVIALNIVSRIKKKTLVIVHKEFLMEQWIERIQQFLPDARVGKIQGTTIDIDDKDIVLGMLQTLSMKTFEKQQFDTFGLLIVDECHHISSEVFSCALFNIVTPYILGLSATMDRKDGTSNVIKMFLGDVVFQGKNEESHNVEVRGISFVERYNDEYNSVVLDFRGNVQYSRMISKLCAHVPRSQFIVGVLKRLLQENPEQQIMVLGHNKCLLKYLYENIDFATKGYYVGGMKQVDLKESETKTVIIATFSMASEALDIKTLSTLLMATPKTDIEQCVGRILRQKNASDPLIVDIIDEHNPFRNQWFKRKQFYRSNGYKILES